MTLEYCKFVTLVILVTLEITRKSKSHLGVKIAATLTSNTIRAFKKNTCVNV